VDGPPTRLRLRVSPGARRSGIVGRHGTSWKVRVTAVAEHDKANDAVLDLLAKTFEVSRTQVQLVTGTAARDKIVELRGLTRDEAESRLDAAAGGRR
jgi:uncharacterized protein (TIGR00251 family)